MISKAAVKHVRISPRKSRLVANLIKDRYVGEALTILKFSKKRKISAIIEKLLRSAIANAQQKSPEADVDDLYIGEIYVNQGPTWKRFRAAAMGRAVRILKRTSHIHIFLEERKGR
ncbi:MAG: 50S ribosomal protein L22 [Candidatus Aminicenantes bacterium]|nr:50S ribosomal protein L22 [Candidatus Aminicenantes bacterium]